MEENHHTTANAAHFVPPAATVPTDKMPDHTTDAEPEPTPEPHIAPEPEPNMSDQVREPTTSSVIEGTLEEYEGSPVPSAKASVDELNSEPLIVFEDMENKSTEPVSSPSTKLLMSVFPPCLPLPLPPPLPVVCQPRPPFLKCSPVTRRPRVSFLRFLSVLYRSGYPFVKPFSPSALPALVSRS
ncbi:hypothetical protein DPX16_23225 [Anabarilius grahami]|uniref:Uncharacterized protein n=1 Tax=Anabarilius grahami TaxID=495550 RepID=A0A3N0YRP2_ANAGA|nr:hypothetical protein DPX16_23225 [Anabarilius grahami]